MNVLRRAIYYIQSNPVPAHQWLVDHYAEAVVPDASYFDAVKALKPSFVAYAYKSATDNYTTHMATSFVGVGNGKIQIARILNSSQSFTCTATSSTQFSVSGSVSGVLGTATMGTLFNISQVGLKIVAGTRAFVVGDRFTVTVSLDPDAVVFASVCSGLGIALESCYLHWQDDTTVTVLLEGDSIPTPVLYPAGSRIELYSAGHQGSGVRDATCFLAVARPAHTKHIKDYTLLPSPSGNVWDGIFLDNSGPYLDLWTRSTLIAGGHVTESGGLSIGSSAFATWQWQQRRDWMVGFKTSMNAAAKLVAINIANYWNEDFLDFAVADRLFQEFKGNPFDDTVPTIEEMQRRHQKANTNSIGMWASGNTGFGGEPPVLYDMRSFACLCLHIIIHEALSSTHLQDGNGPSAMTPSWPDRIIPPAEAFVTATTGRRLGTPTGPAVKLSGTTIQGHACEYWQRDFTLGRVMVRQRDSGHASNDILQVPRPSNMVQIRPNGAVVAPPQTVANLFNGGGVLLLL